MPSTARTEPKLLWTPARLTAATGGAWMGIGATLSRNDRVADERRCDHPVCRGSGAIEVFLPECLRPPDLLRRRELRRLQVCEHPDQSAQDPGGTRSHRAGPGGESGGRVALPADHFRG